MTTAAPDCTYAVAWTGPADGPPRLDCPRCRVQRCILCNASPFHDGQTCEQAAAEAAAAKAAAKAAGRAAAAIAASRSAALDAASASNRPSTASSVGIGAARAAASSSASAHPRQHDDDDDDEDDVDDDADDDGDDDAGLDALVEAGDVRACAKCKGECFIVAVAQKSGLYAPLPVRLDSAAGKLVNCSSASCMTHAPPVSEGCQ